MATKPAAAPKMIGEAVRQRRKQLKLSQAAAAQQAGISRRAWSEVELGQRRGSAETLERMDRVLAFPAGSLAAMEVQPAGDELMEIRRELIEHVNALTSPEELKQARLDLIRIRMRTLEAQLEKYEGAGANTHEPLDEDPGGR